MSDNACEHCGYRIRATDRHEVMDYDVVHVICYQCGTEWVE